MSMLMKHIFLVSFLIFNSFNEINNIEQSNIIKIPLINEKETEYEILPNYIYQFKIENEKYLYQFQKEYKDILYTYNESNIIKTKNDNLFFKPGETVIAKYSSNLNNPIKIKVTPFLFYNELNSIETITTNETFFIIPNEDSIAFFDSLDNNAKIYCNNTNENIVNTYGNFFELEKSKTYKVQINIFDISVIRKYVYPKSITSEINIINDQKIFIYLLKNYFDNYIFNFEGNTMNKIIKLSEKTPESIVNIYSEDGKKIITLDKNNKYYALDKNFNGKLNIEVLENSALIEFLSEGNAEILENNSLYNYEIKGNSVNIKLKKTQKSFKIKLNSNKDIKMSLSFTISNNGNYYYLSKSNSIIDTGKNELLLEYLAPFKYIELSNDEFLSIYINLEKHESNTIKISYETFSEINELLDLNIAKDECERIIKYLSNIFELYVFNDIAKNPPKIYNNYHHEKINLIERIKKVETNSRNFYDFYQEVLKIVTSTRDQHLNIILTKLNASYLNYEFYLPFNFKIGDYNGNKRIFITKNNYFNYFESNIQKFIESHLNIPIKTINNIDPFDYIQNWSLFRARKNPHSQFTYIIDKIQNFKILNNPLYYWNLTLNDYEFEDNANLRLSYKLSHNFLKDKNDEFKERTNENNLIFNELTKLNKINENFLSEKSMTTKRKLLSSNSVDWNINYEEGEKYLKCKVDENNKVNVLLQNSFNYDIDKAIPIIFKCAKLFHNNKYPIIIIESKNEGGNSKLALLMVQLFQIREVERVYSSYRLSDYASKFYNSEFSYIDPETCDEIKSYHEFKPDTDYYNYDGLNIEHKRSKPFIQHFSKSERKAINKFREEFINSANLKRPTDIIIFTDSYSFDAASTLIKGFQNIGGAITVGYFGNPKLEGKELFDASQSDSGVRNISNIIFGNFELDLNFSETETFNDFYQKGNPFPREYELNPVDERVDIYEEYSDDIYSKFINEALNFHKKYNNKEECNSNNTKLIYHDNNNCYNIESKDHAHGGYKCGSNNKWDKTKCIPYYCDIGYYYDIYQEKCFEECKSDIESIYIHENQYSKDLIIKKNVTYEFFTANLNYNYSFDFSENVDDITVNDEKIPRISFIDGFYKRILINKNKNFNNDIKLKINSYQSSTEIMQIKADYYEQKEEYLTINGSLIMIIQVTNKHVLSFNNKISNKIKIAKYQTGMNYKDIIDVSSNYFKDCTWEIFSLDKNEPYFIYFDFEPEQHFINWFLDYTIMDMNYIWIRKYWQNIVYAKKDQTYHIELNDTNMEAMIKLSKKSLNSEVIINYNETKLNSKQYYYIVYYDYVYLNITKEDAIIDILYKIPYYYQVDKLDLEQKNFILSKKYNLINIPKNYSLNTIKFEINSNGNSSYIISQGYSLLQYSYFPPEDEKNIIKSKNYKFQIVKPYKNQDEYFDEELYTVMIIIKKGELSLTIESDKKKEEETKKSSLSGGAIAGIVFGSIGFVVIVLLIIRCCVRRESCYANCFDDFCKDCCNDGCNRFCDECCNQLCSG